MPSLEAPRAAPKLLLTLLLFTGLVAAGEPRPEPARQLAGRVLDAEGAPVAGAIVVAAPVVAAPRGAPLRHATATDAEGRFRLELASSGPHAVALADPDHASAEVTAAPGGGEVRLRAEPRPPAERGARSAEWLALLPAGERKRWFLLDCTGCHQFNETRALAQGEPRSAAQWEADAARMHAQFGPGSGFPILSGHLVGAGLGEWLHAAATRPRTPLALPEIASGFTLTEYDLPGPDLPHDLAVDARGRVLITGMFSARILVLDPASGAVESVPIPVAQANPRALEIDGDGRWWVLLGAARRVARYDPASASWASAPIGMYAHSLALDRAGGVWANDHFARAGLRLARVAPGEPLAVAERTGPPFATATKGPSPIPYELRVAPDGRIWTSLLHGNALIAHDPASGTFEQVTLPDPDSGPRRFDVDARGDLWIPGYASSTLYRYSPATRAFDRHPLPIGDALPYVARVDRRVGSVWVGTGAADALFRFDPATGRFAAYPVPTRGATMRHLAIDPARGDVWIAYGASPAIHPTRIARLRLAEP